MQNNIPMELVEEVGETIGYVESYVQKKVQIAKLNAAEKAATLGARLVTALILLCLAPIILCVFSIGMGCLLAQLLDWSYASSFLLLTGIYIFIAIGLVVGRRYLFTNPILSKIVKEIFK